MYRKVVIQVSLCLMLLLVCGMANAGETVYDKVVNRDKEAVYVISNLSQDQIMRPICKDALNRNNHCRYVPLGEVGMFGKHKSDLTDYSWRKENETVVVVDRSKLDVGQKVSLQRLMTEVFPTVGESKKAQVFLRAQNVGERAWQAIIDVPDASWLEQAIPDLMSAIGECEMVKEIQSVAVLSNEPGISSYMLNWFRYGNKLEIGLDQWEQFRDASGLSHKILAINWNGADECTADTGNEILPPELRGACDTSDVDRVGLNSWQKFCRQASAQSYKVGDTDYWVIRAPSEKHLRMLSDQVVKAGFKGGPYSLQLCDLGRVNNLAVGTYVAPSDPDRKRLVLQQELETAVQNELANKLRVVSVQDWGTMLQDVLGQEGDNPFADPGGADRVVAASNADALLVLWVRDVRPEIAHRCDKRRITPELPAFSKREPSRPDPDSRCPFKRCYPGGSREEREMSSEYKDDLREYEENIREWRREKEDYDSTYRNRSVDWELSIYSTPRVSMVGYLKIIDLKTKSQLWTCPVEISQSGSSQLLRSIPERVRGEESEPQLPRLPENQYGWNNATYVVGQEAFLVALRQGLKKLADGVLWPGDIAEWNKGEADESIIIPPPPRVEKPKAAIEMIGSMPCASSPTGTAKTKLSKAAKDDAISQIFEEAQAKYPSAGITSELISEKAVVVSEGWNPKDKEYRVKVKFEMVTTGN